VILMTSPVEGNEENETTNPYVTTPRTYVQRLAYEGERREGRCFASLLERVLSL